MKDIFRYMAMGVEELNLLLATASPPQAASRALAVLKFMGAYGLTGHEDGLDQFVKFRRHQADMLGLGELESVGFLEGFVDVRE